MRMKTRARLSNFGILILSMPAFLWLLRSPQSLVSLVPLVIVVLGLLALKYLAFRCPHCGAGQIRDRYSWLFIGDRCWSCRQQLDGPAQSEDELMESLIGANDPRLAADLRKDRLEFESLQRRAPTDPAAAGELEAELLTRMASIRAALTDLEGAKPPDTAEIASLRASLRQHQEQLASCRKFLNAGAR